jgi:hypothetical protein
MMSAIPDDVVQQLAESRAPTRRSPPAAVAFHYAQSDSFVDLLSQLGISVLVTTYQANKVLAVRAAGPGLSTLVRTFDQPMGVAVRGPCMALGTRTQVWTLHNAPDIAPRIEPAGQHDACFLPRSCHVTGDIRVHDLAWAGDELWIVNTRFSCLCTLHADYSFVPRWRPPFVSQLAAEDRCHLNGLALVPRGGPSAQVEGRPDPVNGDTSKELEPKYVTCLGETDAPGGWRADKATGGCLIDVPSSETILRGLCMPHSPRWHDGRLWLLESGAGKIVLADTASSRTETVAVLPGFARGLALVGPYAFVGLSKIRKSSAMDGVPLAERRQQLKCGVAIVDLRSGSVAALLEFQTAVEEIFDVQILPGLRFPEIVGFEKETIQHTFTVPPATAPSRQNRARRPC